MPLSSLDLSGCDVSDAGLEVFRSMPLRSLNLCDCCEIADIAMLRGLSLPFLSLEGLREVINGSFHVVRDMPVTELTMYYGATDEALAFLRGKPLTRLNLGYKGIFSVVGLEVLKGMPLTNLNASTCKGLAGFVLCGLPLKCLSVSYFTDIDLDALKGMELIQLKLWDCQAVTDSGLEVLRGMPLTSVTFESGQNLTDAGLAVLRGMALEEVFLYDCPHFTNSGLEVMRGMPLKCINMYGCGKTTEEGMRRVAGSAEEAGFS